MQQLTRTRSMFLVVWQAKVRAQMELIPVLNVLMLRQFKPVARYCKHACSKTSCLFRCCSRHYNISLVGNCPSYTAQNNGHCKRMIECYNPNTGEWSVKGQIPMPSLGGCCKGCSVSIPKNLLEACQELHWN